MKIKAENLIVIIFYCTTEIKINVSSVLSSQAGCDYKPENLFDGNMSTCWAEGVPGDGIGEKIEIDFGKRFEFSEIVIYNGYCKNEDLFYKNNRVKKIRITYDDGENDIFTLNDSYLGCENIIRFSKKKSQKITLEILDVYKGSKWDDTCISELKFQ